jgi:hypothetical protein
MPQPKRNLNAIESLRFELEALAVTAQRTRKLLDKQITTIEKAFDTLTIEQKLNTIATINNILKASHTSMTIFARALTAEGELKTHDTVVEVENIEQDLLGNNHGA